MADVYQSWLEPGPTIPDQEAGSRPLVAYDVEANAGPSHDHNHDHSHDHDHNHDHQDRGAVEQAAVDKEGSETIGQRVTGVLVELLVEKRAFSRDDLCRAMEAGDAIKAESAGARIVARAWVDEAFKARLLDDAAAAAAELGIAATNATTHTKLKVVESTPTVHNLVVCTLCSCYPLSLLGYSPAWYKSRSFRARGVREPRAMLADSFDLALPDEVTVQVHDSTADLRFCVLPVRPAGTEGWSEDQLAALATRDTMIGVAVPSVERLAK